MQAQEIKRLEYLLKQSEEKNNKVTWHNDQLRKDLFNAKQRNNNLATAFGFDDALDAEYAIASGELHDRLCHYFGWADPSQPEQDEALQSRVAALEQELKQLQDRYDALLGAKEKVTARYRSDYKKWKNFKEWLFEDKKKAMHFIKKEKEKRKRKDNEGKGDDRGGGSSPRKEDSPNKTLVNPLNLKRDDAEDLDDLSDTSSVTEDDSQAPLPTPSFDINAYLLSDIAKSINKKKRRISDIADADCSTPLSLEKDFRPSPKKEGSPAKRESPRKQRTPTKRLTSTPTKQCSEEREKENTPSQGKSISPTAGPSIITSKTSSKGKVTNAILGDADTSINALYEIDPARNGGVVFPFSSVVRSKEHRKHLKGGDCECCRDYYAGIGPLPPRLHGPLWNDRSLESSTSHALQPATPTKHRNAISKHRAQWAAPKTPPGYWDIGFPDTQEAASINERARKMQREKMREVEVEARREGGMYKRRKA